MSATPTLDKFRLHPVGGYCTCFSSPYSTCTVCKAIKNLQERWDNLLPDDKVKALKEYDREYPRTSNKDGR
jgi:hypothetical protein